MSLEVRPFGVRCNLGCAYCYQNPQRDAENVARQYDLEVMKAAIDAEGGPFTLFGGEPLLMPFEDLSDLLRHGYEKHGHSAIQTNGTLIEDRHLELFARYRVEVGISIDGPDGLNDMRFAGNPEKTRRATEATMRAISKLCEQGRPPSLIVTLHRHNAAADRLPELLDWFRALRKMGVQRARLHLLEVDAEGVEEHLALRPEENVAALCALADLETATPGLSFDVFRELEGLLAADDATATCVWRACDPLTTSAVRGIEGFGQRTNCGRTNKDGVDFVKADQPQHLRQLALAMTPQEHGGCQGCRFFLACKGQCPGTGIASDWRNRTTLCEEWKQLFRRAEEHLLDGGQFPISAQPNRPGLETEMLDAWARGENPSLREGIERMAAPAPRRLDWGRTEIPDDALSREASRLPFRLPDQTRISWVSDEARAHWAPRIQRLQQAWQEVELESVRAGVRPCALRVVDPRELDTGPEGALAGLEVEVLTAVALTSSPYSSSVRDPLEGEPYALQVAVGRGQHPRQLAQAWRAQDQRAVGQLLGFPACCSDFFQRVWVEGRWSDTTWPMAVATAEHEREGDRCVVRGPATSNILLRWAGVRAVPHLPCSFDCEGTDRLAAEFAQTGRGLGHQEAFDDLAQMLDWPVQWTALHGLAEIKTPVLRITATTDATARRLSVLREGAVWPEHGARGLTFPFRETLSRRRMHEEALRAYEV